MDQINKAACNILRDDLDLALAAVAEQHGVRITVGHGRYDSQRVEFKVEIATINADGNANTEAVTAFKSLCMYWDLQSTDIGREFSSNGKRFRITGAAPRAKKYPILAENLANGKTFKFASESIVRLLKHEDVVDQIRDINSLND